MIRLPRLGLGTLAAAIALTAAPSVRAAEVDKLLPPNTELAVYINIRQTLNSELIKKYALEQMKQALAGNDAQKVLGAMGLDPLKDLDRVVMGASGDDPAKMDTLVILHGTFDADKLYQAAEAASKKNDKLSLVKEGDSTLLKIEVENMPNPVYGTLVDKNRLVFGSKKELVLDAVAGGPKKAVKPALAALITKMDEKTSISAAWAVDGKLADQPIPGANDPAIQQHLKKAENLTLAINVTGDVTVDIGIGMKDATAADEFGKLVDQGIQQAKGFLPLLAGDPKVKPLLELGKTLGSSVDGKQIAITAKLSGDAIAKMLNPE